MPNHNTFPKTLSATALAIAMPLLLLVVLGMVQFGLWYHAQSVVQAACQDGARVASADGASPADGLTRARQILAAGLGSASGAVSVQVSADDERVVVVASGAMRSLIPWVNAGWLPLRSRATMIKERFRPGSQMP